MTQLFHFAAGIVVRGAHTLMMLPEWGGGKGGIYILSACLMKQLKKEGAQISCVLGCNRSELSEGDMKIVNKLNVNIIEPEQDYEEDGIQLSADDQLRISYKYTESLQKLNNVDNTVSFGSSATCLAADILATDLFPGSKKTVVTSLSESSERGFLDAIEAIHSGDNIFSLGYKAFQFINTEAGDLCQRNNLLIPDFRGLFDLNSTPSQSQEHQQTRIIIPWHEDLHHNATERESLSQT